jgi:hypothetical protein
MGRISLQQFLSENIEINTVSQEELLAQELPLPHLNPGIPHGLQSYH